MEKSSKLIYIAGSMSNRDGVETVAKAVEAAGFSAFYDWIYPGEETDRKWQEFSQRMGLSYLEALDSPHAGDVFDFDKRWLDVADAFILVYPAGKSAHTELGYMAGRGTRTFVLLDKEPERWDIMLKFADLVTDDLEEIIEWCMSEI